MPEHTGRDFAAKVRCFNAAYREINNDSYDVIGNLDADVTFDRDYFRFLLTKFCNEPSLGVAGTPFVEASQRSYDYRFTSINHVSGACQLFRKECFNSIGGYSEIREGGIDWVAVTSARLKGWKTRTYTEKILVHHRRIGTATGSAVGARFQMGIKDYNRGNSIFWEVLRCVYQMRFRPLVLGGAILLIGFLWALVRRDPRPISRDLLEFTRREQSARFRKRLCSFLKRKEGSS